MIAILDTNFLVKYFLASKDLGIKAKEVFENPETFLIIPSIVLVEIKYLTAKNRIKAEIEDIINDLLSQGNCMVYPLDDSLIKYIPTELNIHDGIIFATARIQKENFKEDIYVLTKDKEIANLSQNDVTIIW
ncbi:MAG: hypothetical protein A3I68_06290 [Candidatus Melainabacteria bacterium RIFCSPLOWO2_02_FULL_35_15]|nr:MAG: hypothetical protein A3I68_06290 [Candidatus Melainabacteria bacterium RIFCSPLOWO2_02_FULL_35_15]